MLEILRQNQVDEIEMVGIDGNSCIARSAIYAQELGYKVILPCAYIGVKNKEQFIKTKHVLEEKGIIVV